MMQTVLTFPQKQLLIEMIEVASDEVREVAGRIIQEHSEEALDEVSSSSSCSLFFSNASTALLLEERAELKHSRVYATMLVPCFAERHGGHRRRSPSTSSHRRTLRSRRSRSQGCSRFPFSNEDGRSRNWILEKVEEAGDTGGIGLEGTVDLGHDERSCSSFFAVSLSFSFRTRKTRRLISIFLFSIRSTSPTERLQEEGSRRRRFQLASSFVRNASRGDRRHDRLAPYGQGEVNPRTSFFPIPSNRRSNPLPLPQDVGERGDMVRQRSSESSFSTLDPISSPLDQKLTRLRSSSLTSPPTQPASLRLSHQPDSCPPPAFTSDSNASTGSSTSPLTSSSHIKATRT